MNFADWMVCLTVSCTVLATSIFIISGGKLHASCKFLEQGAMPTYIIQGVTDVDDTPPWVSLEF